ncbi:MurR/RpiR family transcriptional regulator [Ideonella livida]|uniref:MurR/RpiR family transcriptional regulator n=1 Tax=Ideonella livida TaxID=2707176 RepID=A0A7C9PJG9_9BURK|nr:MurR/RpiR family transcriptional regulator [Ideonella livida]NDY93515.1 MurR/RpiR family transcriptional regulator [Ideonella livida]
MQACAPLTRPTVPVRAQSRAAAGRPRLEDMSLGKDARDAMPLLQRIREELPRLSRQLKTIGHYVLQHADYLVLERIQDVAERCGTQPSAVVRFAKHFGFHGFQELKQAFGEDFQRHHLGQRTDYRERMRPLLQQQPSRVRQGTELAFEVIDGACAGVKLLQREIRAEDLEAAITCLGGAHCLWVVGARRAYPVAGFLAYGLQSLSKPVQWVDFGGGMHEGQLRGLRGGDALLAISFAPYAPETLHAARVARTLGVPVVALTDAADGPLAREATISLCVPEASTHGFRALTNAMTLAQALFVALAFQLETESRTLPRADAPG